MKGIWIEHEDVNYYAEFLKSFTLQTTNCKIKISADTEYAVYVNGVYVAHGQYGDYPYYKSYDVLDLQPYVKEGENLLAIQAYHAGASHFAHYHMPAGLAFEVTEGEKLVAESDKSVVGRLSRAYVNGECENITPQLGFNFAYDFTKEDDWKNGNADGFTPVKEVETNWNLVPRPIKKCVLEEPISPKLSAFGYARLNGGETSAAVASRAYFHPILFKNIGKRKEQLAEKAFVFESDENEEALYAIFDLGQETAGYLSFDVEVEEECDVIVAYGEHLVDGRVRSVIGIRNFAFTLHLKQGRNSFEHYFRRLGCRYLEIITKTKKITVHSCTLREWCYPFAYQEKNFKDGLVEKLYEIGARTLRCCFHEHYEDCPWREQGLYGMDSRNQMLFAYGVFNEYEAPRASIRLLAHSVNEQGLLCLTSPNDIDLRIPSFSLYWTIALTENARADYNEEFVKDMLPYAEKIISVFAGLKNEKGLSQLPGKDDWNFYEWAEGLSGNWGEANEDATRCSDLLLTSLFVYTLRQLVELEEKVGNSAKVDEYTALINELTPCFEYFYDEEKGVYATILLDGKKIGYHKHTQALVILAGGISKERELALANALMSNDMGLVEQTLASTQLKYDAIIKATGNKEFVFNDAKVRFGAMAFNGATTFWETDLGERDFSFAGSLCHAWSAIPCYLVDKYGWGLE